MPTAASSAARSAGAPAAHRRTNNAYMAVVLTLLGLYALFTAFPLIWLLLSSLKSREVMFAMPPALIFEPSLEGYRSIFTSAGVLDTLVNSVIIVGIGTALAVTLGTLAGYAASRFRFPGRNDFMFFVLSTRMIPPVATLVFYHTMYGALGLTDNHFGMVLLSIFINLGLATWIMKGFFDGVPAEIEEVALVNGYSRLQAFFRLVLPMVKGGIAATAGFCFIFAWNEFTFASVLTTSSAQTFPVRISASLAPTGIDWAMVTAAGVVMVIPVLIFFYLIRRHLLMGMTFGILGRKS